MWRLLSTETKKSWERVFCSLKRRGLRGVKLITSDDHEGLVTSRRKILPGSYLAKIQVPLPPQSLKNCVRKNDREKISEKVKSIFNSPDRYFALMRAKEVVEIT